MSQEFYREEFKRMHLELTDDAIIAENKKKAARKKRLKDKKKDTGYA